MNEILQYFPELTDNQLEQLAQLDALYRDWNAKINVISRKDIDNLYQHHVLHSLAIARFIQFKPGTTVLDLGTGGGFPGIPLAIMFPEVRFRLIDGTGKKVRVAQEVATVIGLKNVECVHERGEDECGKFDFVVSRAVMPLPDLVKLVRKNVSPKNSNAIENGLIVLKGGDLKDEVKPFKHIVELNEINQWFNDDWFAEKYVIYLPL